MSKVVVGLCLLYFATFSASAVDLTLLRTDTTFQGHAIGELYIDNTLISLTLEKPSISIPVGTYPINISRLDGERIQISGDKVNLLITRPDHAESFFIGTAINRRGTSFSKQIKGQNAAFEILSSVLPDVDMVGTLKVSELSKPLSYVSEIVNSEGAIEKDTLTRVANEWQLRRFYVEPDKVWELFEPTAVQESYRTTDYVYLQVKDNDPRLNRAIRVSLLGGCYNLKWDTKWQYNTSYIYRRLDQTKRLPDSCEYDNDPWYLNAKPDRWDPFNIIKYGQGYLLKSYRLSGQIQLGKQYLEIPKSTLKTIESEGYDGYLAKQTYLDEESTIFWQGFFERRDHDDREFALYSSAFNLGIGILDPYVGAGLSLSDIFIDYSVDTDRISNVQLAVLMARGGYFLNINKVRRTLPDLRPYLYQSLYYVIEVGEEERRYLLYTKNTAIAVMQ
ncbi:hypothetical protein [Vibrio campbellii]|uniref:hypothetical protein n=1 Tax=Vibrio campbellii TaxID=680 RepID=UPI0005EE5987|nr:hypothetical protein [Vibrio campbellii]